jgi:toxin ParE2
MTIRFVRAAEDEMLETRRWYDERQPGLGPAFLTELNDVLTAIESDPERGVREETNPFDDRDVRRFRLRRFPYRVIYEIGRDPIRILAVAHNSRRPGYWADRIDE